MLIIGPLAYDGRDPIRTLKIFIDLLGRSGEGQLDLPVARPVETSIQRKLLYVGRFKQLLNGKFVTHLPQA